MCISETLYSHKDKIKICMIREVVTSLKYQQQVTTKRTINQLPIAKASFTNYKRNMAKLELLNANDMADNKRVHHYNYAIKAVFSRL